MCFYCGCREVPLIRELIAEHEAVTDLGAQACALIARNELGQARKLLDEVTRQLEAHWRGEEDGLFDVMRGDPLYEGYIDALVVEHRELRTLLADADLELSTDRALIVAAFAELRGHVAKEEDGLFPASLTALSGEQWDSAMDAWRRAH